MLYLCPHVNLRALQRSKCLQRDLQPIFPLVGLYNSVRVSNRLHHTTGSYKHVVDTTVAHSQIPGRPTSSPLACSGRRTASAVQLATTPTYALGEHYLNIERHWLTLHS
ncbi:unnamed protein product [Pleuronectes platessa]|uniref:Uncharacterized protein n=1 Tax=Pleuronectes platessa TaxID=8262 RepID=A0A9N7VX59_PLEPL|nr:unnamed protein product [Pleuronectes platessa]